MTLCPPAHKKLIEVALPLHSISAREKSIRHRHASTLHPAVGATAAGYRRGAMIFSREMVDDPSAHPDLFPTTKAQEKKRQRLFKIFGELVKWKNTSQ